MPDARGLEDLAAQLARVVPAGLRGLREELERNFRALLQAHLDRLDLVSRERFDTQAKLLQNAQQRLAELEQRLAALESPPARPARAKRAAS